MDVLPFKKDHGPIETLFSGSAGSALLENPEAAIEDGYPFTDDDICPSTKRVHRLGGIRNDGREVWRRLSGRPGG